VFQRAMRNAVWQKARRPTESSFVLAERSLQRPYIVNAVLPLLDMYDPYTEKDRPCRALFAKNVKATTSEATRSL
jgi:hypothetical protein